MTDHFKLLSNELSTLDNLSAKGGVLGFFGEEASRFHSIAGTILTSFKADKNSSVNERYITHILARSLFENYFWIYTFSTTRQKAAIGTKSL